MSVLRRAFQERPLLAILLLAAVLRITAAIFSRGFLTIDDHHVLIDTADGLATGIRLPSDYKRSILYPGSVALITATGTSDAAACSVSAGQISSLLNTMTSGRRASITDDAWAKVSNGRKSEKSAFTERANSSAR